MTKKGLSKYRMTDPVPGIGKPSVYHAVIVIFLEFFAWGLLTTPMIDLLRDTFDHHTLLINGLIQGIKGLLSFLCAPLLGALSDVWGRKSFLLLTVFFTCAPIPLMRISPWWFFAMTSLSGMFAVTFSIVFAYVADITEEVNRATAYGLVSATFAASLVTSPAIGTYLSHAYGEAAVVTLATAIAAFDVCFILVAVPESFPEKLRPKSWESQVTWEQVDPFGSLRKLGQDKNLLLACTAVFLSYLPEAGQYSCIVLYLRHVIGFSDEKVASYIAVVGVLSIITQTAILTLLFQSVGNRNTIIMGLIFQIGQLLCYAFGRIEWMMWLAGSLAALSSLNYPSLSSLVSSISSSEQQGVVQGMVTGIRGLCNGLGPAMFGITFHIFNVQLDPPSNAMDDLDGIVMNISDSSLPLPIDTGTILPGPPFLFGTFTVMMAMLIAFFIPKNLSAPYRPVATKDTDSIPIEGNSLATFTTKHRGGQRTGKKSDYVKLSDSDDDTSQRNNAEQSV